MRSVAVSIFALMSVTACATVSMVPGEVVVEASVTPEQSSLRNVCNAYTNQAKAEHWVTPSNGLLGLAKVLIDGASNKKAAPRTYAQVIEAKTANVSDLYQRISKDIGSARDGLEVVTSEAQTFIATSSATKASLRRDVVSFESALVTAQKSRRNFAKAISIVADRSEYGLTAVETELAALDTAIDAARETANGLAKAHASTPAYTAVS